MSHQTKRSPKQSTKSTRPLFITVGVLLGALVFFNLVCANSPTIPSPSAVTVKAADPASAMQEVSSYHFRKHAHPDRYWMTDAAKDPEKWVTDTKKWVQETEAAYRSLKDTSPLAAKIYEAYPHFVVTEFIDGMSRHVGQREEGGRSALDLLDTDGIEICFISESQYLKYRDQLPPTSLYYENEWNAIMVVGVDIPISFRMALLYHELGHAYKNTIEQAPSANAPFDSDSFIEEELEMHEMEHRILNRLSGLRLEQLYADARIRGTTTKEDLDRFDQMFSLEGAGSSMVGTYQAQYLIGFAIYAAGDDPEMHEQLVNYYRMMTEQ